jgi:metallo-beta-lactamase family protein
MKSSLTFHGGVGAATGANFLLEVRGKKILSDCGFLQGVPGADEFNASPFPYNPSEIDVLLVTHAHADHVGRIPKLVKEGFRGAIYSTAATKDLAELMLADSAEIMAREADETNEAPLYTHMDVEQAARLWKTYPYYQEFPISDDLVCEFKDAGHILGSAIVKVHVKQADGSIKKIAFTGDLGNSPSLFLRDTDFVHDAEYVVIESVYGDRNHESKEMRRFKFEQIIKKVIEQKRTLIVPAFSMERTQDLLYEINRMVEDNAIPPIPVFIDSPLATKVTAVYKKYAQDFKPSVQEIITAGDDVFDFSKLKFTARMEDSKMISSVPNPKIIIAGSGMSVGGRIVGHEIRYLPDPEATILFVGYQAVGTLGRQIVDGVRSVVINGQPVEVRSGIEMIFGYSSHKDSNGLLDFTLKAGERGTLKKVFTVLGEPKSAMYLAQRIRSFGINAVYPELGKKYELDL